MLNRTFRTARRRAVCCAVAIVGTALGGAASADDAKPATRPVPLPGMFVPSSKLDLPSMAKLLLERSSALQDDRLRVELARADTMQARLWENPTLDATWGTIPIGETNPPGMKNPLANIPNYNVGLSYRFLLGKRGPRTDRAEALERGARASLEAATRGQALSLALVVGAIAGATLRIERLRQLLEEGRGSLDVARARVGAGSGTPLEVDRLEIELSRIDQQILSVEGDLATALATCTGFLGISCANFTNNAEAKAYLQTFAARARSAALDISRRPDIRALDASRDAASSEAQFGRNQAIPDPTVRLGYTNDRFTVAGNQENSLNASVSFPLPFVDHGQAIVAAAEAKETRALAQRERVVDAAKVRVESLRLVVDRLQRRQQVLETDMLPRARSVVRDLERAVGNRLIPVTDLIQARRTLAELLIEEIDAFGDAFRASVELMGELALGDLPGY
jgi:cobalt-zinc-cadmium efflux system outer membrane protein